jgi:hypothetical protein
MYLLLRGAPRQRGRFQTSELGAHNYEDRAGQARYQAWLSFQPHPRYWENAATLRQIESRERKAGDLSDSALGEARALR